MKKKELKTTSHRLSLGLLVSVLLLLAGCSKEEETNRLPEGKYLLTFTTATQGENTPKTRVSETADGNGSTWTEGDEIAVSIGSGAQTGKYTLTAIGTIKQAITPLYWQSTDEAIVNGWYPATDGTVDLSDQSSELKYVLKGTGTGSYQKAPQLTFTHQLAKVKVTLTGTAEGLTDATVSLLGYTSCSNTKGTIASIGVGKTNYIATRKANIGGTTYYEALLVPQAMVTTDQFIKIVAGEKAFYYKPTDTSVADLKAGKLHTYAITVNKPGPVTYPAGSSIPTITVDGEYIIEGNGSETTHGIIIEGSPTVTLKNVNIKSNIGIEIKSGTPIIIIEGTNTLKSTGDDASGISMTSLNANVIIKGNGNAPTLYANGGAYGAGIGGNYTDYGNITIEDITVYAQGGEGSPGIGCEIPAISGETRKCGSINIKNSTVTAGGTYDTFYKASPAAIGNGSIAGGASLEQGAITIENTSLTKSKILGTLTQLSGSHKVGNGTGGDTSRGTITIGTIKIIASDGTFTNNRNGYIDN